MKNGFRKENIYSIGVSMYLKRNKCLLNDKNQPVHFTFNNILV